MNLNFLAPLALLGAALVAVPVLLHLIDRRRVPRIDFPALRFLLAAQKRLKRRRRVRDPFLMLLRILALLALVLAFSSPLLQYQSTVPAGTDLSSNVVFLLDTSLSMGSVEDGKTLLERAKQRIGEVVQRLPEGGRVGLVVFHREPLDLLGGVTPDLGKLRSALEQVKPSYEETQLKPALLAGLRVLLSAPEGNGDLYLLSDNTQVSLPGETTLTLPAQLEGRIRLVVTTLSDTPRSNRSLAAVRAEREGGDGGKVKIVASVTAQGNGLPPEAPLDLLLGGDVISRGFVKGSEGTEDKTFTLPPQTDPQGEGVLALGTDALEADNRYYFRMTSRRDLKALVIDGEPGEDLGGAESFFVERALNPRRASGSRVQPIVTGVGAVPTLDPRQFPVVFLLNVSDPTPLAERLVRYVKAGGGLFIGMGGQANIELHNRALGELLPASMGEIKAASVDLTGEKPPALAYPEVNHPIFEVFREAGASTFSTVSFYKLVPTAPTLKSNAEVLLKFTNGLPALLGRGVGNGRVLLFTSSLDRDWTDFPLKSIFLPFVQEATHYLARNPTGDEHQTRHLVGEPVVLELSGGPLERLVRTPEGLELPLTDPMPTTAGASSIRRVIFDKTTVPGHYQVFERTPAGLVPRGDLAFSVNVSTRESDLTPFDPQRLQAMLPGLPTVIEGQSEVQGEVKVDRKRALNHSLLWAFMAFLALEGLVAAFRNRHHDAEVPESPGRRSDAGTADQALPPEAA